MSTTEVNPAIAEQDADEEAGATCAVCPHPVDAHDRIGTRYCSATAASGLLDRGCVCSATKRIDTDQARRSYGR
jgi:hypothetical protein